MLSLTAISMAESSGGEPGSHTPGNLANTETVACIFCRAPLPHSSAPFCTQCGHPQKKCINSQCGGPVPPGAPFCPYCRTPQQSQQQDAAKKCINPRCGATLHPKATHCATCNAPQDPVMEHRGQHPLPHVSQPSHLQTLSCGSAEAPVSQPSTPYLHAPQSASLSPQSTPHSQTGSTVQQQVFLATKRSPDSDTLNSTQKRSKMEVKLANILCFGAHAPNCGIW